MTGPILFLLVDDDADDLFLFEDVLQQVNPSARFQSASNGEVALELLKAENATLPDVIFLDLNMPCMDGWECLAELKKDDQLKQIPVIIYTTSSYFDDVKQAPLNKALCFITKPTHVKELENILTAITDHIHGDLENALQPFSKYITSTNTINR